MESVHGQYSLEELLREKQQAARLDAFTRGRVGLAKFRNTGAEFRLFAAAKELPSNRPGGESAAQLKEQIERLPRLSQADDGAVRSLALRSKEG